MPEFVMLAHNYDEKKHANKIKGNKAKGKPGFWISEKYDGVRGRAINAIMYSRTSKIYTLPDFITKQLESIVDEEGNILELDGEIWFGYDTFDLASGSARRSDNNDEVWEQMTFMVFDTPDLELPFEDRIRKLNKAIKAAKPANIKGVKHYEFDHTKTTIQEELEKIEAIGGEGLVLREPGSMYEFARSHSMIKVKSFMYKEAIVTGYSEGTGKYEGMVGALLVESKEFGPEDMDEESKEYVKFKVGSGLNDWQRFCAAITTNWKSKETQKKIDNGRKLIGDKHKVDPEDEGYKYLIRTIQTTKGKPRIEAMHQLNKAYIQMPVIGDKITFRYKELTKDGNPKFPTFVGVRNYE